MAAKWFNSLDTNSRKSGLAKIMDKVTEWLFDTFKPVGHQFYGPEKLNVFRKMYF